MADFPLVGLTAVIENLTEFEKSASVLRESMEAITDEAQTTEKATEKSSGALDALGGAASAIATGGLTLLVTAVAAVGAALATLSTAGIAWANEMDSAMNKVQARTGATGDELEGLKDSAQDVFQLGLGENFEEVALAIAQVEQVTGLAGDELVALTTDALTLSEVFDKDINESVRAVDQAMIAFGADGTEVMDMVTASIQATGDPADDLLDTVNEYSPIFAQAGFTAEQMFGILNAGLEEGAFNFDKIGDAVKEFFVRMTDGSETTLEALDELFGPGAAVYQLRQDIEDLNMEIENQEGALTDTKAALDAAEGAWGASQQVVNDLRSALNEATAQLNEMARPKLEGMEAFDDRIFQLTQQIKQARLAMLDMDEDTPQFEEAKTQLDLLNKELEKTRLAKEIQFEPVFRELEESAKAGTEEVISVDEAFARLAAKKTEIGELNLALVDAEVVAAADAKAVAVLERQYTALEGALVQNKDQLILLTDELEATSTPAKEFLDAFAEGAITGPEAMSKIIQALKEVEDPLERNQIGVALFGSMWEDLGESVILALDPAEASLMAFEGATDRAREAVSTGLGPAWERLKRTLKVSVAEGFEPVLASLVENITPAFESFAEWLQGPGLSILEEFGQFLSERLSKLLSELGPFIENVLIPALTNFADWFVKEGIPSLEKFAEFIDTTVRDVLDWLKEEGPGILEDIKDAIKALSKIVKTAQKVWKKLEPIFKLVGKALGKVMIGLALFVKFWTKKWNEAKEIIEKVWKFIEKEIIERAKNIWREIQKTFDKIERKIDEVTDNIREFVETAFRKIEDIVDAVTSSIEEFVRNTFNEIETIIDTVTSNVREFVDAAFNEIENIIDTVTTNVQNFVETAFNEIESIIDTVTTSVENFVRTAFNEIESIVDTVTTNVQNFVDTAFSEIESIINTVTTNVQNAIDTAFAEIERIVNTVTTNLEAAVNTAFTEIESIINRISTAIETATSTAWGNIETTINTITGNIENVIDTWGGNIETAFNTVWGALEGVVDTSMDNIEDAVDGGLTGLADLMNRGTPAWNAITGIGSDIANAIVSGFEGVRTFVSDITSQLSAWMGDVETDSGFLRSARDVGQPLVDEIVKGVEGVTTFIGDVANRIGGWLWDIANQTAGVAASWRQRAVDVGTRVIDKVVEGVQGVTNFISRLVAKIKTWLIGMWSNAFGVFNDVIAEAKRVGSAIVDNIVAGIHGVTTFIGRVRDAVVGWLTQMWNEWIAGLPFVGGSFQQQQMATALASPQTQMATAPVSVAAPIAGFGGMTNITNVFHVGGNTITSGMDLATFETRVLNVIRRNL